MVKLAMTENGRIIKFPSFQQTPETEEKPSASSSTMGSEADAIHEIIVIPSISALYKEDQITYNGKPISRIKAALADNDPEMELSLNNLRETLELNLFAARFLYIKEHVEAIDKRKKEYRRLAEHTWEKAEELGSEQIKEFISVMLQNTFGTVRAGKILKRFSTQSQIQSPPPTNILSFRKKE